MNQHEFYGFVLSANHCKSGISVSQLYHEDIFIVIQKKGFNFWRVARSNYIGKMKVSNHNYYVYILTNIMRTVLYTGLTNDLPQRVIEHYLNRGNPTTFTGKYNCYLLLYYETFTYINDAIAREKEIKKWPRQKKDQLITGFNPKWELLNRELFDKWPPDELFHRKDI